MTKPSGAHPWTADPFEAAQRLAALWSQGSGALIDAQAAILSPTAAPEPAPIRAAAEPSAPAPASRPDAARRGYRLAWNAALDAAAAIRANLSDELVVGPDAQEALALVLDPAAWFGEPPPEDRGPVASGPEPLAHLADAAAEVERRGFEVGRQGLECWMQTAGAFARRLAAEGAPDAAATDALWRRIAKRGLAELARTDTYRSAVRRLAAATGDLADAQARAAGAFGFATRGEVEALADELEALRRPPPSAPDIRPVDEDGAHAGGPVLLLESPGLVGSAEHRGGARLVAALAERGIAAAQIVWPALDRAEARMGLAGLVSGPIATQVAAAMGEGPAPVLVGVAEGGVLALALASLRPDLVGGIACLATSVLFEGEAALDPGEAPGLLSRWGLLPHAYLGPLPIGPASGWLDGVASRGEPSAARTTFAGEWHALVREDALMRGALQLGDETVDLTRVACPVLTLAIGADPLRPAPASLALAHLAGAEDYAEDTLDLPDLLSPASAAALAARIAAWLAKR